MLHHVLSALLSLFSFGHSYTDSIVPLQMPTSDGTKTICTAFSINESQRLYGTAAHCVIEGISLNATGGLTLTLREVDICGKPAPVMFVNPFEDIAVVKGECAAPQLEQGSTPQVGDAVSVYGYMWGIESPTLFKGVVSNLNAEGYMLFDMRVGPGHSGSPIVDSEHQVVSVMQISSGGFSGGANSEAMRLLTPYWGQ